MRPTELVGDGDLLVTLATPGCVSPQEIDVARALFEDAGVCYFDEAYNREQIEQACTAFVQGPLLQVEDRLREEGMEHSKFDYKEVSRRNLGRFDVRYGAEVLDELGRADACWQAVCRAILGDDCVEQSRGVVISNPGATDQGWHRDGEFLYDDGMHYPAHALTVFVPLVDINDLCGPTQFYPGSHSASRQHLYEEPCARPAATPLLAAGGVLLFDYRLIHRGTANNADFKRPVAYFVMAKPWFKDHLNLPEPSWPCLLEPHGNICVTKANQIASVDEDLDANESEPDATVSGAHSEA